MKRHFEYKWCDTARRYVQKPEEAVERLRKSQPRRRKKAAK